MTETHPAARVAATQLQPGDVILDAAGHIWFVHGRPPLPLLATATDGQCVPPQYVDALYKPLTLKMRHGAGRQPEDVEDLLHRASAPPAR